MHTIPFSAMLSQFINNIVYDRTSKRGKTRVFLMIGNSFPEICSLSNESLFLNVKKNNNKEFIILLLRFSLLYRYNDIFKKHLALVNKAFICFYS